MPIRRRKVRSTSPPSSPGIEPGCRAADLNRMPPPRDQQPATTFLTEIQTAMSKRHDLLNLAGLCLSVALMVGIALLAGWAAQAGAPAASVPVAARP